MTVPIHIEARDHAAYSISARDEAVARFTKGLVGFHDSIDGANAATEAGE